jgi:Uma2 family endonuclease
MPTLTKLGPTDHGRPVMLDDFMSSDYQEGYQYELIDGMLYATPLPNLPESRVEQWVLSRLWSYGQANPSVINFVNNKARVFVPDRPGVTNPEPDVVAYHDFPVKAPFDAVRWEDISPVLVVEVLSREDPDKDLVRNVELYLQVPSIREYWIFDTQAEGADRHSESIAAEAAGGESSTYLSVRNTRRVCCRALS